MRTLYLMLFVVAAACGEKGEETIGSTAGSTSGGSTTEGVSAGTTSAGATEPTGTASGSGGPVTTTEATSTTSTSATSVGPGGPTTGGGGSACEGGCAADEWCDSPVHRCDEPLFPSECRPRPQGCDDILFPVCGCDGKVYPNECEAQAVGVDVGEAIDCEPPEGLFQCGFIFCDPGSQFCLMEVAGVGEFPNRYECRPLPDDCQPASCDCLTEPPCEFGCEQVEDGGFKTICVGDR